jgi:hypothetical protein
MRTAQAGGHWRAPIQAALLSLDWSNITIRFPS